MRRYAVEALGTFFLVLVITSTALLAVGQAPFAIAAVLMVMIFAGGHVSGAHYNPAVTIALAVRGRFAWRDVPGYWLAQVVGAVGGAMAGRYVLTAKEAQSAFTASGRELGAAVAAEFLLTFALGYVVLNVATSRHTAGNSFYGLAIGGTVLTGALAVGGISGGVFNPAVAVGVSAAGLVSWSLVPLYLAAQVVAGTLAGLAFRALNRDDLAVPTVPSEEPGAGGLEVTDQLTRIASSVEALSLAFEGLPGHDGRSAATERAGEVLSRHGHPGT
jgi:aquaporin Z